MAVAYGLLIGEPLGRRRRALRGSWVKRAQIPSMGQAGTDVAREASELVLADDNSVTIESAIEEGRVIFDNVRKVTFFLVSTGSRSSSDPCGSARRSPAR